MRKAARSLKTRGVTLVELIVIGGVIAVLVAIATPYLFGTREKAFLEKERDKIVDFLKIAQQNAIAAQGGRDYNVWYNFPEKEFVLSPVLPGKDSTLELHRSIEEISANYSYIKFLRLTGQPADPDPTTPEFETPLELTIESKHFRCRIFVSPEGVISSTKVEKI